MINVRYIWSFLKRENIKQMAKFTWLPFLFSFFIIFSYGVVNKNLPFVGDAYESWEVAKSYFDGAYQYRSYVEYRGFLTFFIYSLIYHISLILRANDILTFRFFSSLLFAYLTTVSLPFLFSKSLGIAISPARKVLFSLAVFYFFRNYFLYPSNDYFAFFFLVLAVNNALMLNKNLVLKSGMVALFMVSAVLCRSNYIVSLPFLLVLMALKLRLRAENMSTYIKVALMFLAAFVSMLVINNFFGIYRDKTDGQVDNSTTGLLRWQLNNSLYWQKVEWNAGDPDYYGGLVFLDRRGQAIMDREGIKKEQYSLSFSGYLSLLMKYPVDFLTKYVRHFFSGLDIVYPAIYVTNLHEDRVLFSFLNYTLMFVALINAMSRFIKPSEIRWTWFVVFIIMAFPALAAIPFIIEPRFFFPILLTLHGLAIFNVQILKEELKNYLLSEHFYWLIFAYVFFIVICFTLSASSFEQLEGPIILFNPK